MLIRLDKYLADAGLGTRSTVQDLLKKGRVRVNGDVVKDGKLKIDPDTAEVTMDGKQVGYEEYSYYILNKPAGVLSAASDKKEKTVIDLIPKPHPRDLFPVGRLDRDTVGLLLITNDGDLSHRLLAPGKHVPKTYRVIVEGVLPEDAEERFREGIDIGDEKPTAPAEYRYVGPDSGETTEILLTLTEGRYHEVKRMVAALGCEVVGLERISMGGLKLPEDLPRGSARKLTPEELKKLLDFKDRV